MGMQATLIGSGTRAGYRAPLGSECIQREAFGSEAECSKLRNRHRLGLSLVQRPAEVPKMGRLVPGSCSGVQGTNPTMCRDLTIIHLCIGRGKLSRLVYTLMGCAAYG